MERYVTVAPELHGAFLSQEDGGGAHDAPTYEERRRDGATSFVTVASAATTNAL
jgi:hypothetical protein